MSSRIFIYAIVSLLTLLNPFVFSASMSPEEFKAKLKGPILSVPTPFNADGGVDHRGVESVINRALDYGCRVVAMTAGNGRYERLTYEEVKKLTWATVHAAHPRAICIASAGLWERDMILDYARYAEDIGADALQVARPKGMTTETDIETTVAFYRQVASATSLGIVLHGEYSPELLRELIKIDNIVAMKEDVDLHYYIMMQVEFGKRLVIFGGGNEARYLHAQPYGSPAYYSTLYTYAPSIGQQFWQAMQGQDFKTAVDIVRTYDLPFIRQFSHTFWLSCIQYSGGGNNNYLRPVPEDRQKLLDKTKKLWDRLDLNHNEANFWTVSPGPQLPGARGGHAGGLVGDTIVIAGGCNWLNDKSAKLWLDDCLILQDQKWIPGPQLPTASAYAAYACDDSGLYLAGGKNDQGLLNKVYALKVGKDSWQELPDLPQAISGGSGAIIDGKFYIACGESIDSKTTSMYVLDLQNPSAWQECQSLPGPARCFAAMTSCESGLILLGGLADPFVPLKDVWRYDPQADHWEKLGDLPLKGYCWNAQAIDGQRLLLTGRADDSQAGIDRGIWEVDLEKLICRPVAQSLVPTATAALVNMKPGQWWLIGGEPDSQLNRTGVVTIIHHE